MSETVTIECCPRCGQLHRYLIHIVRSVHSESSPAGMADARVVCRNRRFLCPSSGLSFEHRFSLTEDANEKILEVRVGDLEQKPAKAYEGGNTSADLFLSEVRGSFEPWEWDEIEGREILPRPGTAKRGATLNAIVDEQLNILEVYVKYNLSCSRRDRWRFWVLKLAAILCAAGTSAFEYFDMGFVVIILGALSAVCIAVDAAWPGGMLHNVHLRAAVETRRLAHDVLTEWRKVQTDASSPNGASEAARRLLTTIKEERHRIDRYVADAETSLGRPRPVNK